MKKIRIVREVINHLIKKTKTKKQRASFYISREQRLLRRRRLRVCFEPILAPKKRLAPTEPMKTSKHVKFFFFFVFKKPLLYAGTQT